MKAELGENDPAEGPLAAAYRAGGTVTIVFRRAGLSNPGPVRSRR